jgi:pyrroloquinoline quinone biosynthesis protein D
MKAFDLQSRPTLSPHVRLQTDAITGRGVLLYPEGVLELNPTAHDIVARCNGRTSLAEILAALAAEYDATEEEIQGDVFECLEQLHARQFLVFES